jgi:hypothetical protein
MRPSNQRLGQNKTKETHRQVGFLLPPIPDWTK